MRSKSRLINALLVLILIFSQLPGAVAHAAAESVQVTKVVNPLNILEGQEADVTLNIQGSPDTTVVKPNDIILIIDRSGSMAKDHGPNNGEDKMLNAKNAAKGFIDLVDFSKHRVGVVDFSDTVHYKDLSTNPTELKSYIDTLTAVGPTATRDAIAKAQQLLVNHRTEAQPVILLMTDGDATKPDTNPAQAAIDQAASAKVSGIVFYTIALLLPNENPTTSRPNLLMQDMATTALHHHFVLGSVGLAEIYKAIVAELGVASAYDVTITDVVSPEFEIVPGSYQNNIPEPIVVGNTLTWKINELKKELLTFNYKIRHKVGSKVGVLPVGDQNLTAAYSDYLGVKHQFGVAQPSLTVAYAAPEITSVVADNGAIAGGESVVINGKNFRPSPTVLFGTQPATAVQFISSDKLIVTAPAGIQGSVDLKVTNLDKQFATAKYRYYANPVINSVTPNIGALQGGNDITVTGNYFMTGAKVFFGDKEAAVVSTTPTKIVVKAPASTEEKTVDVRVVNPDSTEVIASQAYTYVAGPQITALSPDKGIIAGGENVVLTGDKFLAGAKVYFNSTEVTTTFSSATTLNLVTPKWASPGPVKVKVVNPDGQQVELANGFTYIYPQPQISSVTPNSGPQAGGTVVSLKGADFINGAKIYVNDKDVTAATTFYNSTLIYVKMPAWTAAERVSIKVMNPDGQSATMTDAYTYIPLPAPTITSITPNKGLTTGGTVVTIQGSDFVSGAKVQLATKDVVVTFVSASQLQFKTPVWAAAESVDVTVTNPDGQKVVLVNGYTFELPPPPPPVIPQISSITPNSGPQAGGTLVSIKGTDFVSGLKVYVNDKDVTSLSTFYSNTLIYVKMPAWTTAEKVSIKLVNPNGESTTMADAYTYIALPAPTITSVTPNKGLTTGGTVVNIQGSNFVSGARVQLGIKDVVVTFVSASQLQFKTPVWAVAESVDVTVTNPDGQKVVLVNGYTFELPPPPPPVLPQISSVTPNSGPQAGGTVVSLKGTDFVSGVKIYVNDKDVTSLSTFYNNTLIYVKMPAWTTAEKVSIKLVNPNGESTTMADAYTYIALPAPAITTVTPNKGLTTGGTVVNIQGSNFVSGAKVQLGIKDVAVTFISASQLQLKTPVWAAAESVDVTVTNPDGQKVVLVNGYTFEVPPPLPTPVITSVTPNKGLTTGGTVVNIQGSDFVSGAKLQLGTKDVAVTFISANQLQFKTPVWTTAESVDVTVTNPDGQKVALVKGYTFELPPPPPGPVVQSISPTSGEQAGGTIVYINGSNFVSGAKVYLDSTAVAATFYNANQLIIRTPAWATADTVNVKVVNPDAQEATLVDSFTYNAPPKKAAPIITTISPAEGELAAAKIVTLTGQNFEAGTKVYFNATLVASTFYNSTTIMVKTPVWSKEETVSVKVVNPDNQEAIVLNGYKYILPPPPPAPIIDSITPQDIAITGGTLVTITGKNFVNGARVKLKATYVSATYMSATQLVIKTPVWAMPELVDVTVENPDGQVGTKVSGIKFVLGPPPVITSITPNTALNTGGDLLTIAGANFNSSTKVYINNVEALTSLFNSADLRVKVPASVVVGAVDVKIINTNDGQSVVATGGLTYKAPALKPAPTITSVTPNSGAKSGGYIININGTYFASTTKVYVNGVLALSTFYNTGLIIIKVPASTIVGPVDITVVNADGQQVVLTSGFTYN